MKNIKKYLFMLLAVAAVGLTVQAWGSASAQQDGTVAVTPTTEQAADADIQVGESLLNFVQSMGFVGLVQDWRFIVMLVIACVLLYLAIVKQYEPLLLLPIAFGMVLYEPAGCRHVSLGTLCRRPCPLAGLRFSGRTCVDYLYLGVKLGIYPCLIFVGVGAMTDFGPLIANPKSLLLGAAVQLGIFATYLGAMALGFTPAEAASTGIIGGADGPTAIYLTSKLAPHLLVPSPLPHALSDRQPHAGNLMKRVRCRGALEQDCPE